MNNVETKIKSDMACKSSQSIAKTLKMFQEMDAKEQVKPIKPTETKFGLKTKASNNNSKAIEISGDKNRQIKEENERKLEINTNFMEPGRESKIEGIKDKPSSKAISGDTLQKLPDKTKAISNQDEAKNSSKVTRSSSTKESVKRYQDKLRVNTSSSGDASVTKRHSTGPVGNIQHSLQSDFVNKVNMGLLKQMQSKSSEEKVVDAFRAIITSAKKDGKENEKNFKQRNADLEKEVKEKLNAKASNCNITVKVLKNQENNIEVLDFDMIEEHEKLAHPTITRARTSKSLKHRRIPSRYAKIQNS